MKKIVVSILALLMLAALLCVSVSAAREEIAVTVLHNCDKALGGLPSQTTEFIEGTGALNVKMNGSSFVSEYRFAAEDVSEADVLAIDCYIPDLAVLGYINEFYVEVSSASTCDVEELQWAILPSLKESGIEGEWFTVYLLVGSATNTSFDATNANYFRIYAFYNAGPINNMSIYMDNIRMCYVGGEDFSELNLDAYQGDNSKVNITIKDQTQPDLALRDEGITVLQGQSKDQPEEEDKAEEVEKPTEDTGATENPAQEDEGFNPVFLIPMLAAVVIAVALAIVIASKKKKVA